MVTEYLFDSFQVVSEFDSEFGPDFSVARKEAL